MGSGLVAVDMVHRYSRTHSIGPVSFSVKPGQVVGLVGSNGSGKTTVMKMALGMLRLHDGSVSVGGTKVVFGRLPADVAGLVERPFFYEELSGPDNMVLAAAGRRDRLDRVGRLFADVGLAGNERMPVKDYSQGMR